MVLKDIKVRENISMDTGTRSSLTTRRKYVLSVTSLAILGALFACTLVAVSIIAYHLASCQRIEIINGHHDSEEQNQGAHYLKGFHRQYETIESIDENIIQHKAIATTDKPLTTSNVDKDVRLPRSIVPITYNISIIPFLTEGNFTFHGLVKILVNITVDCNNITMHAVDLDIMNGTTVKDLKGNVLTLKNTYTVEDKQFFIIMTDDPLKRDMQLEIEMKFIGQISDNLQGFYRSSYENANGEKRYFVLFYTFVLMVSN